VTSMNSNDLFTQVSQQQQAEAAKSMRILDAQDGVTWSATSVSDLVDLTKVPVIGASNLIVDTDRYIVNLLVARPDGGPADTITFVGRRG
jgi:ABC-type cobalamin/Fe3+-siderophores transport system ATPase subunit